MIFILFWGGGAVFNKLLDLTSKCFDPIVLFISKCDCIKKIFEASLQFHNGLLLL